MHVMYACMYMHTTHACHVDIHYIPWCTCTRLSSLHLYPLRAPGLCLVTALLWIVMRWTPLQTGTSLSVPSHQIRRYSTTYSKSYNYTSIPAQNQCLHEYGSTRTRSLLHHGGNRDQYTSYPRFAALFNFAWNKKQDGLVNLMMWCWHTGHCFGQSLPCMATKLMSPRSNYQTLMLSGSAGLL